MCISSCSNQKFKNSYKNVSSIIKCLHKENIVEMDKNAKLTYQNTVENQGFSNYTFQGLNFNTTGAENNKESN